MKKVIGKGVILGVVLVAVLLVAGSAGAAPPMQYGPGPMPPGPGPMPGPWGGPGMPDPWGGKDMPGPWHGDQLEEEPASGTAVRIDFEVSGHKARPGRYEIQYPDGAVLTTWTAYGGAVDSGWINNLELPRKTVWVKVVYYPGPQGGAPVTMHILNPAPDTEYGWISQGMSHAIEVAWPDMPVHAPDAGPVGPDGQPWGPEGWVGGPPMMGPGMGPSAPGPWGMPGGPGGMPGGPGGMMGRPGG